MRFEYPTLLGTPEAAELAKAIVDPHEVLYDLFRAGKFNRDFKSTPGKIAYHVPCHLKAQSIGLRSRDLMRRIPGVDMTPGMRRIRSRERKPILWAFRWHGT